MHPTPWEILMEFGHRVPLDCYPIDSIMEKALVEAHLEKDLSDRTAFLAKVEQRVKEYAPEGLVLACGPTPFLREVQRFALRYKAKTQLCLETRMACGVGACLGCVVKAAVDSGEGDPQALADAEKHNVQTCSCGPNFWAESVEF
jgi:dihydroorotate dehydrogenase electron transfer subunit